MRMVDQAGQIDMEEAGPEVAAEGGRQAEAAIQGGPLGIIRDYLALTKPPIISLLLVTAIGGMFLAQRHVGVGGVPDPMTLLLVCIGGALGAGGANAINHYLDQDIDALMSRTATRPVPGNRVRPFMALTYWHCAQHPSIRRAVLLGETGWRRRSPWRRRCSTCWSTRGWLKRSTPQNIVIGGAAGSIPPVVGWVAVTGSFDLPALYMFAIIFFWTPPHFWALSLLIQRDYERAGVPMLPVVAGERKTVENIFAYTPGAGGADTGVRRHRGGGGSVPGRRGCAGGSFRLGSLEALPGPDTPEGPQPLPVLAAVPRAAVRGHDGRRGL